jgi:hypothetical protein
MILFFTMPIPKYFLIYYSTRQNLSDATSTGKQLYSNIKGLEIGQDEGNVDKDWETWY